jgi:thiol-disulfide isomerase/thioredoxin
MWRGRAGLIAALLALAGCKSTTDPKPNDREPFGSAASRTRTKDSKDGKDIASQTWLDPTTKLPGSDTGVPRAGLVASDPKSPNFDAKAAAQDGLGGKVIDAYNRPAKNIFIRVSGVNDPVGAAALGIQTDGNGYFFTSGLKAGQTYTLTAEATQDGKQLAGTVQTRVPNPVLTIVIREDNGLAPIGNTKPPAGTGGNFPPPPAPLDGDRIPAMGLAPIGLPRTNLPRTDDAFSPETGTTRPVPAAIGGTSSPGTPTPRPGGSLPEPDDLSLPSTKPNRPENIAEGPRNPFTPPSASIPGPPVPAYPVPPVGSPDPKQSRVRPGGNFILVDTLKRNWDFGTDRSGSVVLLEFVTTSCPHCKPVVPVMMGLQSKYGADGLQVIAVLCDEVNLDGRIDAARRYAQINNVNYSVYVESGGKPGDVRDKLGVEGYPTAVLLDSTGTVLWFDHPTSPAKEKTKLEAAIRKALGK